jgi:fatty acid desaturase
MASEDMVGKSRGDMAVTTTINLAKEAKLAREGVKAPGHQILTICKLLIVVTLLLLLALVLSSPTWLHLPLCWSMWEFH